MARVKLENISKVFDGGVVAVSDASLEIADKEFVVLVGPSGCGKSTTLRMIAGLEEITKGDIYIGDTLVNDIPPKDRDIAMVFQNYALYPHMTVYNNMAFGLKLRRMKKDEIHQRVTAAAQILGIQELLERKPKALSGGQRQRVAVGRAIVRKPKVFLFDEPLSNLDAKLRVQMRAEIIKLHQRLESTMIYVTHDQTEAMTMGDRIVVMKDGFIQQIADPLTLYDHPRNKFVAGFIGSPPMNFVDGRISTANGNLYFDSGSFKVRLDDRMKETMAAHKDKAVTFGIRPEDIRDPADVEETLPEQSIVAQVDVVEPIGSEQYVYLNTGSGTLIARLDAHREATEGAQKKLVLNMKKSHFFDPASEQTIV